VTANLKTIQQIPLRLLAPPNSQGLPSLLEVRGEVYMTKKEFLRLNEEREANLKPMFANPKERSRGLAKTARPQNYRKKKAAFLRARRRHDGRGELSAVLRDDGNLRALWNPHRPQKESM